MSWLLKVVEDLVSKLSEKERVIQRHRLDNICPDDGKYAEAAVVLKNYLSSAAEWRACAFIQRVLLETRVQFGQAEQKHLNELDDVLFKFDPLNAALLEAKVTKHDQLAVIEEIGRHVSEETKALLHPGTTSYDILDTARSYLFKDAWEVVMRPTIEVPIRKLCKLAKESMDILQVGRTHLQDTSPVPFGVTLAGYAARLADRVEFCDRAFGNLRGKISGIVGTGASIDMVIGGGKSMEFEKVVLGMLGLEPDYTATQIVQKERLADVGHGLTTLVHVLGDFANDIRQMYSSVIGEVTSRDNAERLGGSSADATKNNPINYENMVGKVVVVESGMRVLYELISSDFQRDLRGSVMARYQPQQMMVETYEAFSRLGRTLDQLSVNEDKMAENLQPIRKNPSEAMVAILRGEKWIHSEYGPGYDFVKEMGKMAKNENISIMQVALCDPEFCKLYYGLSENKKGILDGKLENYLGSSRERAEHNIEYARKIVRS